MTPQSVNSFRSTILQSVQVLPSRHRAGHLAFHLAHGCRSMARINDLIVIRLLFRHRSMVTGTPASLFQPVFALSHPFERIRPRPDQSTPRTPVSPVGLGRIPRAGQSLPQIQADPSESAGGNLVVGSVPTNELAGGFEADLQAGRRGSVSGPSGRDCHDSE